MEYKKHGVAGVEGGPEGQRTQVFLFNPIHTELKLQPTCMKGNPRNNVAFILFRPDVL